MQQKALSYLAVPESAVHSCYHCAFTFNKMQKQIQPCIKNELVRLEEQIDWCQPIQLCQTTLISYLCALLSHGGFLMQKAEQRICVSMLHINSGLFSAYSGA